MPVAIQTCARPDKGRETPLSDLHQTPLTDLHKAQGAKMTGFAGYEMPLQYGLGVMGEHKHTRAAAGLFASRQNAPARSDERGQVTHGEVAESLVQAGTRDFECGGSPQWR